MISDFCNKALFIVSSICIFLTSCDEPQTKAITEQVKTNPSPYLNHSDSAKYVGMNTCKLCHQGIYNSFINTGMGKSFDVASTKKSIANFKSSSIYDSFLNMHYKANFVNDSLFIHEYRLDKKDTVYSRTEQVNYIIGSGQHTNSHIQSVNGYFNQMPMTFYSQKQKWDLPPGFENGINTRFSRKIGLECMTCHNGYPNFVKGSENKYTAVPQGIDCERCHGPGSIHVAKKQKGEIIDTANQIDYSIVNPSKLSIDLQFDVCQRCHLQGNAVLKNSKSFIDFKPGQKLSDVISVFLPKYKNADDEFIMASHADRLKQSACFIKSIEKHNNKNALKPYKGAMTCVTCHNPHVSVKETNKSVFNDACRNCHLGQTATAILPVKACQKPNIETSNCVSCHMPNSGSIDIPHVSVHDHYIRKPISKKEKNKIKEFIGLYAINEKNPSSKTKAQAYLQQYEKFEQLKYYLDSARLYLADKTKEDVEGNIRELVQLHFMLSDFKKITGYVNLLNQNHLLNDIIKTSSYDNRDAWLAYRIGEAYYASGKIKESLPWFNKACYLANYNLEFKIKLGTALAQANMVAQAVVQFENVLKENPKNISALTNLGYTYALKNDLTQALLNYNKALLLDPDYEPLLLNLAGYYAFTKNKSKAIEFLNKLLNKNPKNTQAKNALKQIQSLP